MQRRRGSSLPIGQRMSLRLLAARLIRHVQRRTRLHRFRRATRRRSRGEDRLLWRAHRARSAAGRSEQLLGSFNVSQKASEGTYRTRRNVSLRPSDWIWRQPRKTHVTKSLEKLCRCDENPAPDWFIAEARAAQLAPTAMNRQRFLIELNEKTVHISSLGGPCTAIDLGIVKRHFEIGAQSVLPSWRWR